MHKSASASTNSLLNHPIAIATLATVFLIGGCASPMSEREKGTAQGAGAGALAGAILGSLTGGSAGQGAVLGGAVGAVAGNLWSKRLEDKRKALTQASEGTGVDVARTTDNRLKVNVPADVSFDTGRSDIKPQMRPVLDELGRSLDSAIQVTIVGHTDNTGTDAINNPLSQERAEAVRSYLSSRGLNKARVSVQGRGSHEPVAGNDNATGRAANRRVEIFLSETSS